MAHIHIECSDKFKQLVKEEAIRRKKTIKQTVIMLLKAWAKIKEEK